MPYGSPALYNILLAARYAELARRSLGIEDLSTVSPELQLQAPVDEYRPEFDFLLGYKRCSGRFDIAAVVAEQAIAELRVPPATGQQVGVIERVIVSAAAATEAQLRLFSGVGQEAVIPSGPFTVDTRWAGAAPSLIMQEGTNAAPAGNTLATFTVPANVPVILNDLGIVIQRNNGLSVVCANTNTRILGAIFWRERVLRTEEE